MELKLNDEENDRNKKNQENLHEIRKCKAAIYKISKHKWKIHLSYNHEGVMETRNGSEN